MFQVAWKSLTAESGFHKTPSNTVAVVGQLMKMACWTNPNETTQWSFSQDGERTFVFVYNGKTISPSFIPRFSVDNSAGIGHHDLTVKDVKMTDAGIYECAVLSKDTQGRTTPVSTTAELIVLESDPVCSTNISAKDGSIKEFDYVVFRCAVNFSGQFTPSMQWSEGKNTLNETSVVINSNMQQFSSVTILQVSAEKNGILITCRTQVNETPTKVHYTNATNIPSHLFSWNTTLNVHFGARNVTITPRKDRYRPEDVLNCYADGNPSPTYLWIDLGTNETIATGPKLAFKTRIDADQPTTIECVAQNDVDGELKLSSATIDVIIQGDWQLPFGYIIIGAGVGIFCTLVAVFAVLWIQKKLSSREFKTDLTNENPQNTSPDYDSIPEAEVNESTSMSTTPETAAPTKDVSNSYIALTERPVIVQPPIVYSSLEADAIHIEVLPNMMSKKSLAWVSSMVSKARNQCDHSLGTFPRSWDFGGSTWDRAILHSNLRIVVYRLVFNLLSNSSNGLY